MSAPSWTCGFCGVGRHEHCTGAAMNRGKILVCGCTRHSNPIRCLACGNTNPDEITTGWACRDPQDCADELVRRSAQNPVREEIRVVQRLAGEARRQALHARTVQQVRHAIAESGMARELSSDVAADLGRPHRIAIAPRRAPRQTSEFCLCGCGHRPKGGRFLPGHDARLAGTLIRGVRAGDERARERLIELGWLGKLARAESMSAVS